MITLSPPRFPCRTPNVPGLTDLNEQASTTVPGEATDLPKIRTRRLIMFR